MDLQFARNLALRRLNRSECSSQELRSYLQRKGVTKEMASDVVRALIEQKLVDDERYTRILARQQALRGKGSAYISMKLKTKGITAPRSQVSHILDEVTDQSELERACAIVERRFPLAWSDRQEAARAVQALVRRGFSFEIARAACSKRNKE